MENTSTPSLWLILIIRLTQRFWTITSEGFFLWCLSSFFWFGGDALKNQIRLKFKMRRLPHLVFLRVFVYPVCQICRSGLCKNLFDHIDYLSLECSKAWWLYLFILRIKLTREAASRRTDTLEDESEAKLWGESTNVHTLAHNRLGACIRADKNIQLRGFRVAKTQTEKGSKWISDTWDDLEKNIGRLEYF